MKENTNAAMRITRLLDLAQTDEALLKGLERFRQTLAVMFSDIQGSTSYFEKYGDAAGLLMVHRCNDAIRSLVEKHGGRVVKTIGDGTMATFPDPKRALESAVAIQMAFSKQATAEGPLERVALRIGLHYGAGIVRSNNDVFGDVVNMAARVENVAKAGQIVVSEEVVEQVRGAGFDLHELGRFALKGKSGERTLFRVDWSTTRDTPTERGIAESDLALGAVPFRLQIIHKDGSAEPERVLKAQVAVALDSEGLLTFSKDLEAKLVRARLFLKGQSLFVEDRSTAGEGIFLRLANPYSLEDGDIFLAGKQVFRYEEKPVSPASVKELPSVMADDSENTFASSTEELSELVQIDSRGNILARDPLSEAEIKFGRTQGARVFSDDNLMSCSHFRVMQRGGDCVLEDLGSRNGTFVRVRRETALPPGSALLIAGQVLKVLR